MATKKSFNPKEIMGKKVTSVEELVGGSYRVTFEDGTSIVMTIHDIAKMTQAKPSKASPKEWLS